MSATAGVLRPGMAVGVGSMPHADVDAAVAAVLRLTPELPAAPQLPARSPAEFMLAQAIDGMAGVRAGGGGLVLDPASLDPEAEAPTNFDDDAWAGLRAFLREVRSRTRPVKVQLCGPVTLGLALVRAGASPTLAGQLASRAVTDRISAVLAELRRSASAAPPILVLDEPALTAWYGEGFPWSADDTIDLLSGALAAAAHAAVTGVHCCGPTEWRLALAAGPQILSVPVGIGLTEDPVALAGFLDAGGWVAWGAVPTGGPVSSHPDRYLHALLGEWEALSRGGVDPAVLRSQALVTPACGLAGHTVGQAEEILNMTARIGDRVRQQAQRRAEARA